MLLIKNIQHNKSQFQLNTFSISPITITSFYLRSPLFKPLMSDISISDITFALTKINFYPELCFLQKCTEGAKQTEIPTSSVTKKFGGKIISNFSRKFSDLIKLFTRLDNFLWKSNFAILAGFQFWTSWI